MMQFIFDYLDARGQYAHSREEQSRLEKGISLYLNENGRLYDASILIGRDGNIIGIQKTID